MTGNQQDQLNPAIQACRHAGLPVIDPQDCTCAVRGRLVVLARANGLEIVWPYDQRCPIHGPRDRGATAADATSRRRSRSQAARETWARRKAGTR